MGFGIEIAAAERIMVGGAEPGTCQHEEVSGAREPGCPQLVATLFGAPARPRPPDTPEIRQSKVKEIRTAIERGCYMTEEKLDQTVDRLLALLMGDRI